MIKNMGGRLSEQYSKWFFQQMVLAVDFCHNKGIFNRDIKLQNILLQVIYYLLLHVQVFNGMHGDYLT